MKTTAQDRGSITEGVTEFGSVVYARRPAISMNLLLVQSCITDLLERRLTALGDYGDLGQPGVRVNVLDLEYEHLPHVLRMARMPADGALDVRRPGSSEGPHNAVGGVARTSSKSCADVAELS